MQKIKPIYIKLLLAAAVLYIISTTFALAELYRKIGDIEHALTHIQKGDTCHHK